MPPETIKTIAERGAEITAGLLLALIMFVIIYDVAVAIWVGQQATISAVIYGWAARYPVIAFAVGLVTGHLFWRGTPG